MKTWVRKTLSVGVLAAGALLFAPGAAQADVFQDTSGNVGILNGTQVFAPVAVPLNVVGNSAALLGVANATGAGVNRVESVKTEHGRGDRGVDQDSAGNFGILNGTQLAAPINIPINVCGNSLAVLGVADSAAACANGVDVHGDRGRDQDRDRSHGNGHGIKGDGGHKGHGHGGKHDDHVGGDHGDLDDDDTKSYGKPARKGIKSTTEAGSLDGLTQNLSNAGGLKVLDTLVK